MVAGRGGGATAFVVRTKDGDHRNRRIPCNASGTGSLSTVIIMKLTLSVLWLTLLTRKLWKRVR